MNCKQWLIAGIMIIFAVFGGCTPEGRYRTLSLFFDGVPPPRGLTAEEARDGDKGPRRREDAGKQPIRQHGPYAAKMCEACHLKGGGKLILPVEELCMNCHDLNLRKKRIHGPVASGGCRVCHHPHGSGKAFLLVSEPSTFCFYCHDEVEVGSREVHQAKGGAQCTNCHDPHSSDYEFMLK